MLYDIMKMSSNGNIFRVTGLFVWGIHRSPVNSPHIGQWRGALMFSLICAWINNCTNAGDAGDLRRHRAHYDVNVIYTMLTTGAGYILFKFYIAIHDFRYITRWSHLFQNIRRFVVTYLQFQNVLPLKSCWLISAEKNVYRYQPPYEVLRLVCFVNIPWFGFLPGMLWIVCWKAPTFNNLIYILPPFGVSVSGDDNEIYPSVVMELKEQ